MKKVMVMAILVIYLIGLNTSVYAAGTDVGIWYATWYAKTPTVNTDWISGFGASSLNQFVGDVNGDGKDDAITYNSGGVWNVALSNSNGFNAPAQWTSNHGIGSDKQFLADVNGDGKKDAIVYFGNSGNWYIALSNGSSFDTYTLWITGHGVGSNNQLLGDVNGDGKADAVVYFGSTGTWYTAVSNGNGFNSYTQWITGHGVGSDNQLLGEVNGDGKEDAVAYFSSNGNWYAANSNGSNFENYYTLTTGHGSGSAFQNICDGNGDGYADAYVFFNADINADGKSGDLYGREYSKLSGMLSGDIPMNSGFGLNATKIMQGNVTGDEYNWKASVAFFASTGTWKVERYRYIKGNLYDTWSAGFAVPVRYVPYTLGSYQTYDSGNEAVIDEHLSTIASTGINWLLLDETNNINADSGYILNRATKLAQRIKVRNDNIANTPVKYAFAIGAIQWSNDPLTIEQEAGQVWNEFANNASYGGSNYYYYFNGKPLLVVYSTPAQRSAWESWGGNKTNSNRFTIRWAHSPSIAGTYGWEVRNGAVDDNEVMVVMPGWNNNRGVTPVSRANGDYYNLSCWDKVITRATKPSVVVINSFNEFAEETAVQVADTNSVVSPTEKWYDKGGTIDNSMYWNMTVNFINLLKSQLFTASTLFSKGQDWYRWKYLQWNGSTYSNMTWDSTNSRWKGDQTYCLIGSNWQHPDANDSIRAWVAPYAGTVRIQGVPKLQYTGGDGVVVKILKGATTVWGPQTITTTTGISHDFTTTVSANDVIYFVVNKNGTNTNDTTLWDPVISYQ